MWKHLEFFRNDYKDQNVRNVLKGYCRKIVIFFIAFVLIDLIRLHYGGSFKNYVHEFFKVLSIVLSVVAVAGNPGWRIQSWVGNNPIERWNNWTITGLITLSGIINMFL